MFGFLNICNSGFLYFFGFLVISWERKELLKIRRCQNKRNFEGFSDFQNDYFCFCIFLDLQLYLGNEKSYQRSAGVKTTGFLRAFQISKKWNFLISGFLDFCIFLDFWLYLGNEMSYWRSAVVKATKFFYFWMT